VVERSFLESIDDALAEKASLQSQLPEVMWSEEQRLLEVPPSRLRDEVWAY